LLDKLPSYFLKAIQDQKALPFDRLAWDTLEMKPSFRQFCQLISEKFLHQSIDDRLRDTTAGSVRLAVAFLGPWFRKALLDDFEGSMAGVYEFSCIIAKWPAQWWTRDHGEMWDIIRAMIKVVAEELQEKNKVESQREVAQPAETHDDVELPLKDHEMQTVLQPLATPPSSPPMAALRHVASSLSIVTEVSEESVTETVCEDPLPTPPPSPLKPAFSESKSVRFETPTKTERESPVDLETALPTWQPIAIPQADSASESTVIPQSDIPKPHSMAETASCIVTGFLFGAYIALCVLASQRRPLQLYVT
jgi:hypothetical protein